MWLWLACGGGELEVVDRDPLDRTPLSASCDDIDPVRCQLPWPSNTFTVADPTRETGLRVNIDASKLPIDDDPSYLNTADGFSRVSGVVTAMPANVDTASVSLDDPWESLTPDGPLQVINAQPDSPNYGRRMGFRAELLDVWGLYLLIGRPVEVMEPNADHVVIVTDAIGTTERSRSVELALGLVEPETEEEAALVGWHAPTRQLIDDAGVDPARVIRTWTFTTRSAGDPTRRLHAMMDQLTGALDGVGVEIDSLSTSLSPSIAGIVLGRLTQVPAFLPEEGGFNLDAAGLPVVTGTRDVPFRLVLPAGEGDYHVALYGHGTGGDYTDSSFDAEFAQNGLAKLNMRFDGWTGTDLVETLFELTTLLKGSASSTQTLLQALAGGNALLTGIEGPLADAVSADTIAGQPNPAAGRRPESDNVAWIGGSMGGTLGAVMVAVDHRLRVGVLNVPGGGWTHMIPYSVIYTSGFGGLVEEVYGDPLDVHHMMAIAQGNWDEIDGAVYADEALAGGGIFLLQESMDDPILPNLSTDILANALGAVALQPGLETVLGLTEGTGPVTSGAALEQFRVPDTGQYDVHGFAAMQTIASDAALEQMTHLVRTSWDGTPEIVHPTGCDLAEADGACDFSDSW